MKVLLRTEGDHSTGFGHVRRCLSLAEALREIEVDCSFLIDGDALAVEQATTAGFPAWRVRGDESLRYTVEAARREIDCVVIDSYRVSSESWLSVADEPPTLVAIDDFGSYEIPAHVVVNSSFGGTSRSAIKGASVLCGPEYALLRAEFAENPGRIRTRPYAERILITVGGSDPCGITPDLISWAEAATSKAAIDVVVGPLFVNGRAIERLQSTRVRVHHNPRDMRSLMLAADLAVCAGGQTTFELAATGTPAVAVRVAANQTDNLRGFAQHRAIAWVGDATDADLGSKVGQALAGLAVDSEVRREMSERGRALVDGHGSTRVAEAIVRATLGRKDLTES